MVRMHDSWGSDLLAAALLVALTIATGAGSVHGQATEPAGYRAAVEEAVLEFELGHFQESLTLFERAHAVYTNARTFRGIGMTEFELRHYGACIIALKSALDSSERPLEGTLRDDTEELLARAYGFVADVTFAVRPTAARVRLDGVPLVVGQDQTVLLTAGEHMLEAEAAGYLGERRRITLRGGRKETVQISLVAPPPEPAAAKPDQHESPNNHRLYKNPWLWTAVGVVAAGAAVGTAVALRREPPADRVVNGSPEFNGGAVSALWGAP